MLAKRGNGSTVLYNAKNVIVSTGGFCRNVEMIDGYCPDYSGVYTEVGVGCTGEGCRWASTSARMPRRAWSR